MNPLLPIVFLIALSAGGGANTQSRNPAERNPLVRHCLEHPKDCERPSWSPEGIDTAQPKALDAAIGRAYEAWKKVDGKGKPPLPREKFIAVARVDIHDGDRREETGTAETVPIFALDGFLAREAPGRTLSMLKIDVQGFEMDVLNGAAETITRDRPNVLCEVTPGVLARTAGGHRILLTFFEGRDYRATILWPDEDRLEPVEFDRLARMLDETDREYFDVLFTPAID